MERNPLDVDVLVVGLGAWGSATLAELALRGVRAWGIDQFSPPHAMGSHHGQGRVIRMASPEGEFYTPMMARAYELWRRNEQLSGMELLTEVGGVYIAPPEDEIVAGALASYASADIPHDVLTPQEAAERFPWVRVEPDEVLVFEAGTGRLHPERSIVAHLAIAKEHGAHVQTNTTMLDWQPVEGGYLVSTTQGEFRAKKLILTLGSWAARHLKIKVPLVVERQVFAVYQLPAGAPQPTMFCFPAAEAECMYGLPEEGNRFKVALHHGGELGEVEDIDTEVRPRDRELIEKYVAERLPILTEPPVDLAVCRYTDTPDRHFVITKHPLHPGVVIGAGCSGRGYKFATFIGEALADLSTGTIRPDLDPFSPARFARASTIGETP